MISSRSKTGTTRVQMICALLDFQTPDPPAPLAALSPWLDHLIALHEEGYAQMAAQQHPRFIKTHTPLDGNPLDPPSAPIGIRETARSIGAAPNRYSALPHPR